MNHWINLRMKNKRSMKEWKDEWSITEKAEQLKKVLKDECEDEWMNRIKKFTWESWADKGWLKEWLNK